MEIAMKTNRHHRLAQVALATCALFAATAASALPQRTFVSRAGVDTNPCSVTLPCRAFTAAIAQTAPGGEVIVLDSAGYGAVTITQSVSIVAPRGIYAGVSVTAGDGITINAGATDVVKLRGLTITGLGGANGIVANTVGLLDVANVEVSGFTAPGLNFAAPGGQLVVADSAFTNNAGDGVHVQSAAARNFATMVRSRFDRNNNGAVISSNAYGELSDVSASYNATNNLAVNGGGSANIADCAIAGLDVYASAYGVGVTDAGSFANVSRCRISGTPYGVLAYGAGAKVAVADTTVASAFASGLGASFYGEATIERCTVIGGSYSFAAGPNGTVHVSNSTAANPVNAAFYANAGGLIESRNNNTTIAPAVCSGPGTCAAFGAH
jgi:hypothetical protein